MTAEAVAGELPCIMDMDGPTIPNFAWAGTIIPLDDYMSDNLAMDLIPPRPRLIRTRSMASASSMPR